MLSNRSPLVGDVKPSRETIVTFETDEKKESDQEISKRRQARKQAAESYVRHEIQSWSAFFTSSSTEEIVSTTNKRTDRQTFQQTSLGEERSNRSRSALIDRSKHSHPHHHQVTCHSLFSTMFDINEILDDKSFFRCLPCFQTFLLFIDSCLRGVGQVMFANNPLSGLLITIGLFIGQWQLALYGLLGTMTSTLIAQFLGLDSGPVRSGLYGSNGCLTALAIAHFSSNLNFGQMLPPIVLMSACSTLFFLGISRILVTRLGLSPFTFIACICSFLWLLAARNFPNFSVDKTLLTTVGQFQISNETNIKYSIANLFAGFCASISQVYFVNSVLGGLIILLGVFICSPILAFLALLGAITGQLSAAFLFGSPPAEIRQGLWGYNSVLTCQALGGMFFLLRGYHVWLFTLFASLITVITQAAISIFVAQIGMSPLLLPSTIVSWLFCLMAGSSKNMVAMDLRSVSTPEAHLRRSRLKRLVNMQFEFMKSFSTILRKTDRYGDISMDHLVGIEGELVPILLCSFAHRNDTPNLKTLLQKGANVNSSDYDSRSPLHIAACGGDIELCRLLITKFRANVNSVDDFDGTPLYDAFCHGNFHLIPYLYARGARMPVSKTKELIFYLCAFSFEGNLEAVQYLLACGVNPNLVDYGGRTALHLAVCGNHFPVVKYLVEIANASLAIQDYYGQTPVDDARCLSDKSIASYLQHERNASLKQKRRSTIIRVKKIIDDSDIDEEEGEEEEEEEKNAGENSSTSVEESLLPAIFCMAAAAGNIRQMASILQQFPQFRADSVDYDFRSAAHVAAAENQLLSVRFLYDYCHSKNYDLQWINREDRWGCTPIEEAYRQGNHQVANYLKERITKYPEPISPDLEQNQWSMSEKLGISLRKWRKILHFATLVYNNDVALLKGLLASGVLSSSELYADYDGRTPMHLAAANGYLEIVKLLQLSGDNGRICRDRWKNCALDEAKRKKFDQIVDVLLDDIV